eukprot:11188523-Lingulodinium_polyedra.AAC.1
MAFIATSESDAVVDLRLRLAVAPSILLPEEAKQRARMLEVASAAAREPTTFGPIPREIYWLPPLPPTPGARR